MKKIIYSLMTLGLAFTSCQKEEIEGIYQDPNAVVITATVGENSIFGTRTAPLGATAEERQAFSNGDKIAVTNGSQGGKSVTYTYDGTAWDYSEQYSNSEFLTWDAEQMNFSAYYPAIAGASLTEFTLPIDQSDADKIADADYMRVVDEEITKPDNNTISLDFTRETAKVVVNIISFGDEFGVEDPTITDFKIVSAKESLSGSTATPVLPYKTEGAHTYTALVLPVNPATDVDFITLSANGKSLKVRGIPAMERGKSYTYNLTVGKDKMGIESVEVADWTSGTTLGEHEMERSIAKVGDYYYRDGTWSTEFDHTKHVAIGIIYSVGEDKASGKVVSVVEGSALKFSSTDFLTYARDESNGRVNMATIVGRVEGASVPAGAEAVVAGTNDFSEANFPAFHWVHQLNGDGATADIYTADAKNVWYFPSDDEIKELYNVVIAYEGGIAAFSAKMESSMYYGQIGFDEDGTYYSSSEDSFDRFTMCSFWANGRMQSSHKGGASESSKVRAILEF